MKKKLRKIVVEGMPFWWTADWFYHPDQSRILRVCIWGGGKSSQALFVNLTSKWIDYPVSCTYPMPRDIHAVIAYALEHGWKPSARGKEYWLKEEDEQLELEELLLTDAGRLSQAPGPLARKQAWTPA
ncbi:MAG TPA: hypothetical protein VGD98_12225 [Ktedonobacteraceae bacterium]